MANLSYEKKEAIILFCVLLLMTPLLFLEKGDAVIWLNKLYNPYLNIFFKYITYLGTAYFYLIPFTIYLRKGKYHFVRYFLFGFIFQAVITYTLKDTIFFSNPRPTKYFEGIYSLTLIDIEHAKYRSFPSGHTATIFSLYTLISLATNSRRISNIILVLAILVGISRIYLAQHFFIDVFGGIIIGSVCSFFIYFLFRKKLNPNLQTSA